MAFGKWKTDYDIIQSACNLTFSVLPFVLFGLGEISAFCTIISSNPLVPVILWRATQE